MAGGSKSPDPICSSCYNGFLPIIKHLQSLTANGHAFHEPCIQHLFASCWNEEISYCPVSKTNLRCLKSESVPSSCQCGETVDKLCREVKQLKERMAGKYILRKSRVRSSRCKKETLRRLYLTVMKLQSKVMGLDRQQNNPKFFAKEVDLERNPSDTPIGPDSGISSQCNQGVEPLKSSPSERQDNVFGNLKEVPIETELTLGPTKTSRGKHGVGHTVNKVSDNLMTEATVEHSSIEDTSGCKKVNSAEPVEFSPEKANTTGSKVKTECIIMDNEFVLGSFETYMGNISAKVGISNSHDGNHENKSTDPVNSRTGKSYIEKTDKLRSEDSSVTELNLRSTGTNVEPNNIGFNVGIFNRSSKTQSAEPSNFNHEPRPKLSGHSVGTRVGENVGFLYKCNKSKSDSSSIGTTKGQCIIDLDKHEFDTNSSPSKRIKRSLDNQKADDICSVLDNPYSIERCLVILNQMKDLNPSLYNAAKDLFENPNWRKFFVSLKKEKRLIWLISMFPGV